MASDSIDTTRKTWWRRRLVRWCAAFLLLAVGVSWFGWFAYLRITLRPTPRPEYWNAKLRELYPLSDDAMTYKDALAILRATPWASTTAPASGIDVSELLSGAWEKSREDVAFANDLFESDAFIKAYEDVHRLADVGWRHPDMLSLDLSYDCLLRSREWHSWILVHSRWAAEEQGDVDMVIRDWITGNRLVCHATVGWSFGWVASGAIQGLASEIRRSAEDGIGGVDTRLLMVELLPLLERRIDMDLVAEDLRICGHHYLERIYVREGGDWLSLCDAVEEMVYSNRTGCQVSRLWNLASPIYHDLPSARRMVEEFADTRRLLRDRITTRRAAYAPNGNSIDRDSSFSFGIPNPWSKVSFMLRRYREIEEMEAAVATLALSQYRQAYGAYPDNLDQLVPEFLPRLPIDYADREPLRYRRDGYGYLLYSIGVDGIDDGGGSDTRPDGSAEDDTVYRPVTRD